ncbi:hypothetical protein EC32303_A0031 [Escherichia coli 3.2303]|nr:hypothetical protein EC32303_A0031 [Escherichia coli 3.2303]
MRSASFRASLRNSGECCLRGFYWLILFLSCESPLTESLLT